MQLRRQWYIFLLPALLAVEIMAAGCAMQSVQPDMNTAHFLHDTAFPDFSRYRLESHQDVFRLNEKIQAFLDIEFGQHLDIHENSVFLANRIIQSVEEFTYAGAATTTATQTFQNREANCLSMTIMAYAMAKYLGFNANFQLVNIPEYWEWYEHNSLIARHVNLVLTPEKTVSGFSFSRPIIVDFFAPGSSLHYGSRTISESTVLAMFYNNKGATALLAGKHDLAYAYLRAALLEDHSLDMAISNLALLYTLEGAPAWAERNYREVMKRNPDNTASAEGLAVVLRMTGRYDEADAIMARIKRAREVNPYYQYVRGEQAYNTGNWQEAIRAFNKAIELRPDIDQPYFGLAKAYFQLGDRDTAERYLRLAERHTNREDARKRYQSKLALLTGL